MSGAVSYHSGRFPPAHLDWQRLVPLIGAANAAVARYDGLLSAIPNASVLLSPLTIREAVLSLRIEGTQATMGEVLELEARGVSADSQSPKEADIWEVLNYRKAMRAAEARLTDLPLSQRLIHEAHKVLLSGVRGHGKSPGAYRRVPNWIGPQGCSMDEARYIPIAADRLPDAMSRWERYLHADAADALVQLAILHAEFEALHPCLDGNGRLGRMLIPLFLFAKGLIHSPMFYISAYLEANRDTYYDRLLAVSRDDAWTDWCLFFLEAVQQQAQDNLTKANAILTLYNDMKPRFVDATHSQYAILALDWIVERPIFNSSDFVRSPQIPPATAKRILSVLKQEGILRVIEDGAGQRAAVLAYPALLNTAEGYDAF